MAGTAKTVLNTATLGILQPLLDPLEQPKPDYPPVVSPTTGEGEASALAKDQKRRLAALSAGGQINTSRGGVLADAPVARASLLGN